MIREILLLGNPKLYETSAPILRQEVESLRPVVADLHDTLVAYRRQYGAGRAIAAPQIGVQKRLLYLYIDHPVAFLNPELAFPDRAQMAVLDDCMSFPGLLVRLHRYCRCVITYRDLDWTVQKMELEGDLSELLQHEYDHLDGILATQRAENDKALVYRRILL